MAITDLPTVSQFSFAENLRRLVRVRTLLPLAARDCQPMYGTDLNANVDTTTIGRYNIGGL